MKIEKINDRQIRCTLTREDLASREIKISELTYGSAKAKALFHDMIRLAERDYGFDAENIPVVVEAIPISGDTIILIITKIEDPEELDTRFARFSPENGEPSYASLREQIEGADGILDLIRKITEAKKLASEKKEQPRTEETGEAAKEEEESLNNLTRVYSFYTLDDAIRAAAVLGSICEGPNTLYKNPEDQTYFLLLKKASHSAEQFNKICNILSEYAVACKAITGLEAYFSEHMELILAEHALQDLAQLHSS